MQISFVTVGIGDTLFVFDQGTGSLSLLSPDYKFVRSLSLSRFRGQ